MDSIGLGGHVEAARVGANSMASSIPVAVLYSAPDGAWAYAMTACFARMWRNEPLHSLLAWALLGPALAIGSEVGQALGVVPGTFDFWDLFFYSSATIFALLFAFTWSN